MPGIRIETSIIYRLMICEEGLEKEKKKKKKKRGKMKREKKWEVQLAAGWWLSQFLRERIQNTMRSEEIVRRSKKNRNIRGKDRHTPVSHVMRISLSPLGTLPLPIPTDIGKYASKNRRWVIKWRTGRKRIKMHYQWSLEV